MENNDIASVFLNSSDLIYSAKDSSEILKALNDVIHGLYHIGNEESYIISTFNTATYVEAEYKRLLKSIGMDLDDIANKLEMIRSLLFGDCFNWDYIQLELSKLTTCRR